MQALGRLGRDDCRRWEGWGEDYQNSTHYIAMRKKTRVEATVRFLRIFKYFMEWVHSRGYIYLIFTAYVYVDKHTENINLSTKSTVESTLPAPRQ